MRYQFQPVGRCNMRGFAQFDFLGMRLSASQGTNPRSAEGIAVPVKQCQKCGLIFSDPLPIPMDLADHYGLPPDEYWGERSWTPEYFSRQIVAAKELINFKPGMKALDIGAGMGFAMKSLAIAGFDTWGIEPSEPFRRRAIELGVDPDRLQPTAIEDSQFEPESFDFIAFGAVLEHLVDPRSALEKTMGWLKPGGVVQAEVPSANWLIAGLINRYFRLRRTNYVTHLSPMHSPFHLYEFTLRSFGDFNVAKYWIEVCEVMHVPFKQLFRRWMERTGTGMQLTVYLRRN